MNRPKAWWAIFNEVARDLSQGEAEDLADAIYARLDDGSFLTAKGRKVA